MSPQNGRHLRSITQQHFGSHTHAAAPMRLPLPSSHTAALMQQRSRRFIHPDAFTHPNSRNSISAATLMLRLSRCRCTFPPQHLPCSSCTATPASLLLQAGPGGGCSVSFLKGGYEKDFLRCVCHCGAAFFF